MTQNEYDQNEVALEVVSISSSEVEWKSLEAASSLEAAHAMLGFRHQKRKDDQERRRELHSNIRRPTKKQKTGDPWVP